MAGNGLRRGSDESAACPTDVKEAVAMVAPNKVGFIPHWRKGNYDEV